MKQINNVLGSVPGHWVGDGFPVRSLFSYAGGNRFDPFLLLDYAGPHRFEPAEAKRGVGEHPHRGFETVTIVYQGELEHRDSSGSHGVIGAGDVQWMTAASGVVHEEFHSERFARAGGTLEMAQLWVNLPASDKMSPPRYQELPATDIPKVAIPGGAGEVRVVAGQFESTAGVARTVSPINVWDLTLSEGANTELQLPDGHTTLMVVRSGAVHVGESSSIEAITLVEFDRSGTTIALATPSGAELLLLTGEPIGEPVVGQGPFVMNTREEIRQAMEDYRNGRMGKLE